MATKTDDETNGCTFQWKIENISYCLLKEHLLNSPVFFLKVRDAAKWSLLLNPKANEVDFFLCRDIYKKMPNVIEVNCQFVIIGKEGSILIEDPSKKYVFGKDRLHYLHTENKRKIFVTEREKFLPEDTLTVQCKIWEKQEEKPVNLKYISARTVFKENRKSFEWRINKLYILKPGLKNKFKDSLIEFDLVLIEGQDFENKLGINISSIDERVKYLSLKTSVVDFEGIKEKRETQEFSADYFTVGVLPLRLFTKKLMKNKNQQSSNDLLSLNCEYVITTATTFYESFRYDATSPKLTNEIVESGNEPNNCKEKSPNTAVLLNDLKFMYNDAILSDTELRTSTRTFPAHKNILSARSPVFRSMFSNDMKERNSGYVDITDFEEDSVHRMLLYMYTDSLEDLQVESTTKLYAIADKYEILSLKSRCSSFLKENLCPEYACDVLVLADLHNDDDLKCTAQDYILGKRKQIFCSPEWKQFMGTHLKLAADVMYKKIYED